LWRLVRRGVARNHALIRLEVKPTRIPAFPWAKLPPNYKLDPENTKTNAGRLVPLNEEMVEMLKELPRGLPGVKVCTFQGKPLIYCEVGFVKACRRAGIEDFTFHGLGQTGINNWRIKGHDYFRIMAASGHKTVSVFKRYNTVSKDELKALLKG
jgi:integrase